MPTIYSKLILDYEAKLASCPQTREFVREQCSQMIHPMMSASAALPESIHRRWYEITGHNLIERYGMTECGAALANPLTGERIPGLIHDFNFFKIGLIMIRYCWSTNAWCYYSDCTRKYYITYGLSNIVRS